MTIDSRDPDELNPRGIGENERDRDGERQATSGAKILTLAGWAARKANAPPSAISQHNKMLVDRIKGAPALPANAVSDSDPQNPSDQSGEGIGIPVEGRR